MKMPPLLLSLPDLDRSSAEREPALSSDPTPAHQAVFPDACAPSAPVSVFPAGSRGNGPLNTPPVSAWRMLVVAAGVGLTVSAVWWQASLRRTPGLVRENGDLGLASPIPRVVKESLGEATKGWAYRPVLKESARIRWAEGQLDVNRLENVTNTETALPTVALPETNALDFPAATMEMKPVVRAVPAPSLSAMKPAVLGLPAQGSDTTSSVGTADFPIQTDANIGDYIDTTRKPGNPPVRQDSLRR